MNLSMRYSLVAQTVKCLPAIREIWVRSLGWKDSLEKEMAIHSSTLAWKIPWTEEPGRLQSMGLQRVRHDWATSHEMGIPDHLTCLLRNLYADQEATVRSGHGTTDWFQIGKGVRQGCILSPCLFNLYAEYILRNAGLDEKQVGIKVARRNINLLRYADDTILMAESEEELNSLLMKVKEESKKVDFKINIQKTKIMASGPITSWQTDGETMETVTDYFLGLQNHCRWWLQSWN